MWLNFKYLFDECFQQDDLKIQFNKNKGMCYINFEHNEVLCITANNYTIDIKKYNKRVDVDSDDVDSYDFEINVCLSTRQLRILYERYNDKSFLLSEIDDLEDTESDE